MTRDAGVIRDAAGLTRLLAEIDALQARHGQTPDLLAARLVAVHALARRESRGGHFRADFPGGLPPVRTFIGPALKYAAE
jgi:L-aspartate oxidase